MPRLVFSAAVLFTFLVALTKVCSCERRDVRSMYCVADYVARVRVRSGNHGYYYYITLEGRFKGTELGWQTLERGIIDMRYMDPRCRVYLQSGRSYLIAGRLQGGHNYRGGCIAAEPWENVAHEEDGYKGSYNQQCRCDSDPNGNGRPPNGKGNVNGYPRYPYSRPYVGRNP